MNAPIASLPHWAALCGASLSVSVPVLLVGVTSAVLVRRWMPRSKVFVWVISLVLLNAFLLYLAAMIFMHSTQPQETIRL